jgi:hypothetical protein
MHEYFSDISSYDGALLPGVKLPSVIIDQKYYQQLNIDPSVDNFTFLRTLCERSLVKKNLNKEEYKRRLEMELGVLNELGFVDYVLLNWDITNFCHVNGIPINEGRGSAAGSLVLFLIGVTKVDSVKNELIFERFVNVSRAKTIEKNGSKWLSGNLLCDVDLDIEMFRRQEVIKYIEEKHLGKTCKILTINTLSSKLCIKEVGKMIGGLSEQEVSFISDYIPKIFGKVSSFDEAIAQSDRFRAWAKENPKLIDVAKKIHGLNKNTGVHPSGITISYFDINETFPTSKTKDGDIISAYDMKWVSEFAVKFDILGLRSLSVVDDVCKSVGIKIEDIDPNDPLIYESLQNLRSPHGLFQIEADVSTKVCRKVKPKNLNELSAVMSLARPGSLSFVDTYAKFTNENIIDLPDIESKELKEILSETGGSILFQETGMKICHKVFGMTLVQAENVRKACGKKVREDMMKFESIIKDYGNKHGIPKSAAFFWDALLASADYSFNRCLHKDSVVYSDLGIKTIEEIKKGDLVLSLDTSSKLNKYVEVKDVHVGEVELFEILLENGRQIRCSMQHKFLCEGGQMHPVESIIKNNYKICCDKDLEYFKDVVGYEGSFLISNKGSLKSLRYFSKGRNRYYGGGVLKGEIDQDGYIRYDLKRNYKSKHKFAHRLIMEAFCPNINNLPCVNHKNGVKIDNSLDNLEWISIKDNNNHAYRTGLNKYHPEFFPHECCEKHPKSKLTNDQVLEMRRLGADGISCKDLSIRFNINKTTVWKILKRTAWTAI